MAKKNIHVVNNNGIWQMKVEGNQKASKTFNNKTEAVDYSKSKAKEQQKELVIHNMDGKIAIKNTYGKDPCPPKDKNN